MTEPSIGRSIVFALAILAATAASGQQREASRPPASIPDVAGIRPGISAEEAYSLLKARNASIQIGVGEAQVPGLGEKPIVTTISAQVLDARAPEILTVWLTLPPAKQVVWAIGRRLDYDANKPLLTDNILPSLRQKYGQETAAFTKLLWLYDHQGSPVNAAPLRVSNYCLGSAPGNLMLDAPSGARYSANTVLMNPPQPETACNSYIGLQALLNPSGAGPEYTQRIDLLMIDYGLSRQAQMAYQDYLKNAANAKAKEDLEKAKQRKGPIF